MLSLPRILALTLAGVAIAAYALAAFARVGYPYELEWMEGSMVDHVSRVLAGQPLYVPPSIEFVPYLYTPLFYYVSGAVSLVTGPGFLPLRLVSLVASAVALVLVAALAARETGRRTAGVIAAGVFAATYPLSGAWFDIGRVDSLYVALLLGAMFLVRTTTSRAAWAAAGLLLVAAFQTKQVGLVMAVPLVAYGLWARWREGLVLAVTALGGIAASVWLLDWLHDGWYTFYVFRVPSGHAIEEQFWTRYWTGDLLGPLPIASLTVLALLLWQTWRARHGREAIFYPLVSSGILVGCWSGRLHTGGWENALIPAHALVAILFGVACGRAWEARHALARYAMPALASAQLLMLAYDPMARVPKAADVEAGDRLVAMLASIEGEVWLYDHGHLPTLAGKRSYAPAAAVSDVLRATRGPASEALAAEIEQAIATGRFAAIIVDTHREFPAVLEMGYWEDRTVFAEPDVFWPMTGYRKRPEYVFLPYVGPNAPWNGAVASN